MSGHCGSPGGTSSVSTRSGVATSTTLVLGVKARRSRSQIRNLPSASGRRGHAAQVDQHMVLPQPGHRGLDHVGQLQRVAVAPATLHVEAHVQIVMTGSNYEVHRSARWQVELGRMPQPSVRGRIQTESIVAKRDSAVGPGDPAPFAPGLGTTRGGHPKSGDRPCPCPQAGRTIRLTIHHTVHQRTVAQSQRTGGCGRESPPASPYSGATPFTPAPPWRASWPRCTGRGCTCSRPATLEIRWFSWASRWPSAYATCHMYSTIRIFWSWSNPSLMAEVNR